MLGKFLRYFGNPLIQALGSDFPSKTNKYKFDRNIRNKLDVLLEINNEKEYGLFFTPNGNYGDVIEYGAPIKGGRINDKHGIAPYLNCFFQDIDLKATKFEGLPELWEAIDENIKTHGIPPTFVDQSGGGYHLFWVFHPDEKAFINDEYLDHFQTISEYMKSLFTGGKFKDGADKNAKALSQLMRLPLTNHRKTGEPIPVKLFQYNKENGELSEGIDDNKMIFVTKEHMQRAVRFLQEQKNERKDIVRLENQIDDEIHKSVNTIPFDSLFEKLSKYPKSYKGNAYTFKLVKGTEVCIVDEGGAITHTDGYKYHRSQNYINCFSDPAHPIDERPRGPVLQFLYYYFDRDFSKSQAFLKKEFKLSLLENLPDAEDEIVEEYHKDEYDIVMTKKKCSLKFIDKVANGTKIRSIDLFQIPFEIVGRTKIALSDYGTESDKAETVFIIKIRKEIILLKKRPSKRKFNDKMCADMFFYGDDNMLGMFYEALECSNKIPEIPAICFNGYYDNSVVLGGEIIYKHKPETHHLYPLFPFKTFKGEELKIKQYIDLLCNIYDPIVAIPSVLQMIALAGMNLWKDNTVYPAMLITGMTGTGKTTLYTILKRMIGYDIKSREYALPGLTPQPLKQYASDNSVLFLSELTNDVIQKSEQLLRNVVNRELTARGTPGGSNIAYNLRSPLCVVGERTFTQESLNNRFLTIVLDPQYLKGDNNRIMSMMGLSCVDEIYGGYMEKRSKISALYQSINRTLKIEGFSNRVADVRTYPFVIDALFNLKIGEKNLMTYAKANLKNIGITDNDTTVSSDHELKSIIMQGVMKKKIFGSISDYQNGKIYHIGFDEEYLQTLKARLHVVINKINSQGERLSLVHDTLSVRIKTLNAEKIDIGLNMLMEFIHRSAKYVFTYDDTNTNGELPGRRDI